MMKNTRWVALCISLFSCLSGAPGPAGQIPPAAEKTRCGFFPSPSEVTLESLIATYRAISEHGDVVLLQQNVSWADFVSGIDAPSQEVTDIGHQYELARAHGLEVVFVVDPLNGLDRREFAYLPSGWEKSFANPKVRAAYKNFTLRIVREFGPRRLGLASEINTYADTHPEDFPHFVSLYRELVREVKAIAPATRVFVTFQWEELNNLVPAVAVGKPYQINWEQVEIFEPNLDVWAISSYPFVAFDGGAAIPKDYYTPLLSRTQKPLAVAEGGMPSEQTGHIRGSPADQVNYLTAIHDQIGRRLSFWIYLLITDFNLESYRAIMEQKGDADYISTLGFFARTGLMTQDRRAKPALSVWDSFRDSR